MNTRTTVPKGNFMSPEDRILPRAFVAAVLICFSARAQVQQAWVTHYNGPGTIGSAAVRAMAVDRKGNVSVTGVSGGPGTGTDYATIKYDVDGNQLWAARYSGPSEDYANAIAADSAGNIYVTGESLDRDTDYDYVTIKYDANGNGVWTNRYNGPGNRIDSAYAMAVDSAGSVYVTGRSYSSDTGYDYATLKYDTDGNQLWAARYNGNGTSDDVAYALAVDDAGNVYVTGGSASLDTGWDYATIKYDAGGHQLWVARFPPGVAATALAVDSAGKVYVTGWSADSYGGAHYATVKYDAEGNQLWAALYRGPLKHNAFATALAVDSAGQVYVTGQADENYATLKYDAGGNPLWVARYVGPGGSGDSAQALAVDGSGNVYVTGSSGGSGTGADCATIKYDNNGNQIWAARYNGPDNHHDVATALAVNTVGDVYVSGHSSSYVNPDVYVTIKYVQTTAAGLPAIITEPKRQVAVNGTNVTFSVVAAGSAPLFYQWRFNGVNLPGATDVTFVLTNVQASRSGDYSVVITNLLGVTVSPEVRLTVVSEPWLGFAEILPGREFQFGLVGDPGLLYEIQWSSDLVRWLSLTNLSSTIGLIQLGDSIATNSSQRFYRAVVPP